MRIFFDTNVLFSAFGYSGLCFEVFRECIARHKIIISGYVIEELLRNIRVKLGATEAELTEIQKQLSDNCEIFDSYQNYDFHIRDAMDIPILSAAVDSKSEMLVTGDKDLLEFASPPIPILTPRALHNLLFSKP